MKCEEVEPKKVADDSRINRELRDNWRGAGSCQWC